MKQNYCLCSDSCLCLFTWPFTRHWEEVKTGRFSSTSNVILCCLQGSLLEGRSAQFMYIITIKNSLCSLRSVEWTLFCFTLAHVILSVTSLTNLWISVWHRWTRTGQVSPFTIFTLTVDDLKPQISPHRIPLSMHVFRLSIIKTGIKDSYPNCYKMTQLAWNLPVGSATS